MEFSIVASTKISRPIPNSQVQDILISSSLMSRFCQDSVTVVGSFLKNN